VSVRLVAEVTHGGAFVVVLVEVAGIAGVAGESLALPQTPLARPQGRLVQHPQRWYLEPPDNRWQARSLLGSTHRTHPPR
jgi:hypothetical protein